MNSTQHTAGRSIADTNEVPTALDAYLDELQAYPPLAAAEEAEVARLARAGDERATARLVSANLRFVVSVAKKYKNRGLDLADLIAEGNLGLVTAARKFEPERGHRFISYAIHWVRQAILLALAEQSHSVRLPPGKATDLARLRKARSRLYQRLEREPTAEELAEEAELSVDAVHALHGLSVADERTDADAEEDGKRTRQLADARSTPLEQLLNAEHSEVLARALHRLPPRLGAVLRLRYELNGSQEHTLGEVGRMLGVSSERARQLSEKALAQLRADRELAAVAGREPVAVPVHRPRAQSGTRSRRRQAAA